MRLKPIPKDKRLFGLKIDCSEKGCNTLVNDICKKTGEPLEFCKLGKHTYKVIAYEPNTGIRRTKNLGANVITWKEALILAAKFQEEVKSGKREEKILKQPVEVTPPSTPFLADCMAGYVAYIKGSENVPEHKRRKRNLTYTKYIERTFKEFVSCQNDRRVLELKADEVTEEMIGKFHSFLHSKVGPVTYNMKISSLRSFFNHLMNKGQVKVNPFYGVLRRPETHKISVLTKEQYEALLKIMQKPELGRKNIGQTYREMWRPWLLNSVALALESGRRTEELLMAKVGDIVHDDNGKMAHLNVIDFKVSRLQNRLNDNPKIIKVPITKEMEQTLLNCGVNEKGSEEYIIGSEEIMDRLTMKKFLSKSFTHYWNQLDYSKTKKASIKILRKTYLSSLAGAIGISNARVISQHSDTKVLQNHYVNDEVLGATVKNFSVFPKQEERQAELNKLRNSGNELSLEK